MSLHENTSVLWGLFCVDTPIEQLGMSGGCAEILGKTETNRNRQRLDIPYGCFGFLPLKRWLLTTDPSSRLIQRGLKIVKLSSLLQTYAWRIVSIFRPIYLTYQFVHCQPTVTNLLSVSSSFWRVCTYSS